MAKKKAVPNDKYWQDRAEERLSDAEKRSAHYINEINSVYDNARWKIIEVIKSLYDNYYKKDTGFDNEKLQAIMSNGTLKQFRREMSEAGLSEYLPENYKARMTRLEYLYAQCWAESKKANMKHYKLETDSHKETIKHGYYKNIYDTAVGLKINPVFSGLNSRAVNEILNTQFVAGNYSKHIWKNTDKLARTLKEVIGSAVAKGEGYEKTARLIRTRFDVTKSEAIRLVRTETCYFQNQAEIKSLKEMGFKKYQFIATLDSRTSGVCRDHDKIVFDVDKAQAGFNLPPLHPNCRSTITAYLGKEYEADTRIARNENGVSEYVENVDYSEWLKRNAINISNAAIPRQSIGIKDGLSPYDKKYISQYDKLDPIVPPKNIYDKQMPNTPDNEYSEKLTNAEIDLIRRVENLNYKVTLIHNDPRVPTKDFKVFGVNWELKTPTSTGEMVIRNTINKATDQGKRYIMIDVTYLDKNMSWIFDKLEKHLSVKNNSEKIDGIIIVRGNKFIKYK